MLRKLVTMCLIGSAALLGGCWDSHLIGGGGSCGGAICSDGEMCCRVSCDGATACQSRDLPCTDLFCPGDCVGDFDCAGTTVCIQPPGLCGGPGSCRETAVDCPRDCPMVCGCDGMTYCNECVANRGGVSVARPGSCGGVLCGGVSCGPAQQCCPGCFGEDTCSPRGERCPEIFCPGECLTNADCTPTQYCSLPSGICDPGGAVPGTCAERPTICDDFCTDVCGCDGMEYCNDCYAAQLGVNIGDADRCAPRPCGRGGRICTPDEYCDQGAACGARDEQGCRVRPINCPDVDDPQCGCDGRTYGNGCAANAAGVTVATPGACPMPRGVSCADLLRIDPSTPTGPHRISADGTPVIVWCDMDTDGGGWTLVASTRGMPLRDAGGGYHTGLATDQPPGPSGTIWRGMRGLARPTADVRFTCRPATQRTQDVDLSFYDVIWYEEWTLGSDAQSCFSEANGMGQDLPEPARRDNLRGLSLPLGTPWSAGYLEGEDRCDDENDFTVDLQDRGMDSNQEDGTDWGADDGSPKCGRTTLADGVWQIWLREL